MDTRTIEKEQTKNKTKASSRYREAVGRRKEAVARVRLYPKDKGIIINDKNLADYFVLPRYQETVLSPLKLTNNENKFKVSIKVKGGGLTGQTEAIRLGISRALLLFDNNLKSVLKGAGFLRRDARVVERKKYGLKKARRAPQWRKR